MEKINYLKLIYLDLSDEVEAQILLSEGGCSEYFLEELTQNFLPLPLSYLEFLRSNDGIGLDWITLYGSSSSIFPSLFSILNLWKESHNLDFLELQYCPIGEDSGSNVYCINKDGAIVMFDSEIYEEQEPCLVSNSFETFIDECVLGKRYPEFSFTEDNEFYDFLVKQGWA
ncbi:SMI1/KNR4 family protein [Candidatus Odyssella thessalonicensis]|uniref:SMI1/KNR4 family protein n=1 Tax=Candidatus Odyssella thessalonicensis TaxID=84647 RepID=UPI001112ADEE|nr:SMI1/KNR4 family protein [Candidatus Odyssella thessalonicensis]